MTQKPFDGSELPVFNCEGIPSRLIPEYTRQHIIKSKLNSMKNLLEESLKAGIIREGRRQGNTTRMIDLAVQILLTDGAVVIDLHDKPEQGERGWVFQKIHFAEKILRRMKLEHSHLFVDMSDDPGYGSSTGSTVYLSVRNYK